MNPNSTPPEGLCARVAASGGESEARGPEVANEAQAGAQGVDPRAVILDAITTAINAAGFWLAIEGRRAIADAVIEHHGRENELLRRAADPDDLRMVDEMLDEVRKRLAAEAAIERVRATADQLDADASSAADMGHETSALVLFGCARRLRGALDEQSPTA